MRRPTLTREQRDTKRTTLDIHDLSPAFLGRAALMGARRLPLPCSRDLFHFFSFLTASVGNCLEYLSRSSPECECRQQGHYVDSPSWLGTGFSLIYIEILFPVQIRQSSLHVRDVPAWYRKELSEPSVNRDTMFVVCPSSGLRPSVILVPANITDEIQRIVVGVDKRNFQFYQSDAFADHVDITVTEALSRA